MKFKTHLAAFMVLGAFALGSLPLTAVAAELTGFVSVTSDYMSRGTSQNVDDRPDVRGALTYTTENGYYGSVFASTMDFGETAYMAVPKDTTKELDFFVGKKTQVGKTTVDVGIASINYPDNHVQWNFVEYYVKAERPVGDNGASIGGMISYTDSYFAVYGEGIWVEAHGSYPMTEKLSLSASVAHQSLPNNFDYSTWNVGATYAIRPDIFLDVRYSDTDGHDLDPIYNTYDSKVSTTLTKTF